MEKSLIIELSDIPENLRVVLKKGIQSFLVSEAIKMCKSTKLLGLSRWTIQRHLYVLTKEGKVYRTRAGKYVLFNWKGRDDVETKNKREEMGTETRERDTENMGKREIVLVQHQDKKENI